MLSSFRVFVVDFKKILLQRTTGAGQRTSCNGQRTTDNGQRQMAEIKSTLDIIMEKAKKFSVTEEEKKGFKRQELEGKIKGLFQKTLDGVMGSEKYQVELAALQAKEKDLVDRILKEEVVARIELGANNEVLLKILENIAGPASAAIRKAQAEFENKAEREKESRRRTLVENSQGKKASPDPLFYRI